MSVKIDGDIGVIPIGNASGVAFTPVGGIAATNVQAALQEVDAEKVSNSDIVAFRAYSDVNQTVANKTYVKANMFATSFNHGNGYDVANAQFIAPVKGIYHFDGAVYFKGVNIAGIGVALYVNGTSVSSSSLPTPSTISEGILNATDSLSLNAGDVVDLRGYIGASSGATFGARLTYFSGFLVRKP